MRETNLKDYVIRRVAGANYLVYVGMTTDEYIGPVMLNEVGADICEQLIAGKDSRRIVKMLSDKYGVDESVIINDVDDFVGLLDDKGISTNLMRE